MGFGISGATGIRSACYDVANGKRTPRFGISSSSSPFGPIDPDKYRDRKKAEAVLKFKPPKPKPTIQKLLLGLNRWIALPWVQKVTPVVPKEEVAKLKQLTPESGNIIVGPHPSSGDSMVMFNIYHEAGKLPAGFFMSSEAIQKNPWIGRKALSWVGVIPVARGNKNPEAIEYLVDKISDGGWGGIFPEGEVYFSRQVMPMEYGALRVGVDAALLAQEKARQQGLPEDKARPIFVTPFAHVYFHTNPKKMKRKMEKALAELEARPEVFGKPQTGPLIERIRNAGGRLLEAKAQQYGIPQSLWQDSDVYARGQKLQKQILNDLEMKYKGSVSEGYERRRAMKVRMEIYNRLKNPQLTDVERDALKQDIQKTRDVILLVTADRNYKNHFNDMEMWGELLRRFRDSLKMKARAFGPRKAVVKILPSIAMHPIANQIKSLPDEESRMNYLFEETEKLRQSVQEGVNEIVRENPPIPAEE